jgi:pimeloyl-ACP methyl ester carboxylesterase
MTNSPTAKLARSNDGTQIGYQSLGSGKGVLVLGGALRNGADYMRLAQALAGSHQVHLIDRRGRGASGRQGPRYGLDREIEDLLAVQSQTGAGIVFGHSYGGLIALEAARRHSCFSEVIVYEPGVSVAGSIPSDWTTRYRQLLASGDERGAFATMVCGVGFAPAGLSRLPLWSVKLILRLAIGRDEWQRMRPHLATSVAEHEELAALDDGSVQRYRSVKARVLLLGGSKSPLFTTTALFEQLGSVLENATSQLIGGLDHTAPDEKAPEVVAKLIQRHLQSAR